MAAMAMLHEDVVLETPALGMDNNLRILGEMAYTWHMLRHLVGFHPGECEALGVSEPCHHVLVPAFTCAACADAIVHAGGRPIPIDCDLESYGVSLEAVQTSLAEDQEWLEMDKLPEL
eukprot:symbB.v1.2.038413.t1/scaffold5969.1/size22046/1